VTVDDDDLARLLLEDLRALGPPEAELHVLGGERVAVVELQPLPELELVGALVRAHRPRLGQAGRQVVARHRLHERVVHGVHDPERGEHADDLGRIEPLGRQRDVERPAHLAVGLGLGERRPDGAGQDQCAQHDRHHQRQPPLVVHRPLPRDA
jgi:hypothetical protein